MCELKYVSIYYPEIYEKAKVCRETIIQKNIQESEANKKSSTKIHEYMRKILKCVNDEFDKQVATLKQQILGTKGAR